MPLSSKGRKIMRSMQQQYGSKRAERVFHASINKGTIKGVRRGSGDLAAQKVIRGIRTAVGYEGAEVEPLSTRTKKSVTDSVINTYRTMAYLLTEIGDTAKGKAFIQKAVEKRLAQYDAADKGGTEAYHDTPPSEKDVFRVSRGKEQIARVGRYMHQRQRHEDAADTHGAEHIKGYLQHRRELAKHPKASKRDRNWTEPETKEELQQDMGDYGARRGTQEYRQELGQRASATRKRLKDLGTTTTASVGMKKVLHNIKLKKQSDNYRSN